MNTDGIDTGTAITYSLLNMWNKFLLYIPQIVGALIILLVGWIIGSIVGKIVTGLTRFLENNELVKKSSIFSGKEMQRFSISRMLGSMAKWFIIIAFLIPTADALNLPQISNFLNQLVFYIPNIIAAAAILVVGFVLADFVKNALEGLAAKSKMAIEQRVIIANIIKYSIYVFTVMAALIQLRIVPQLIEILFAGLVLTLALAFGLGGREHASEMIGNMRMKGGKSQ